MSQEEKHGAKRMAGLARVGEGDVSAQSDHADAGGDALVAAKASAILQFALEGSGEENDNEVSGGIEDHGDRAEKHELKENVTPFRGNELRDEGKEKQGRLGIQSFGDNSLAKRALRWLQVLKSHIGIAAANHAEAKPYQIRRAGVFDGVKGNGGRSKNRGDTERCGKNVKQPACESAERRLNAFALAAGKAARQNIEDTWPWRNREDQSGREEQQEVMWVRHLLILPTFAKEWQGSELVLRIAHPHFMA